MNQSLKSNGTSSSAIGIKALIVFAGTILATLIVWTGIYLTHYLCSLSVACNVEGELIIVIQMVSIAIMSLAIGMAVLKIDKRRIGDRNIYLSSRYRIRNAIEACFIGFVLSMVLAIVIPMLKPPEPVISVILYTMFPIVCLVVAGWSVYRTTSYLGKQATILTSEFDT